MAGEQQDRGGSAATRRRRIAPGAGRSWSGRTRASGAVRNARGRVAVTSAQSRVHLLAWCDGRGRRWTAGSGGDASGPGASDQPLMMASIFSSYSSASASMSPPAATLPKNSSRIFAPSTAAQPGAAGVSFEFERRVDQGLGELVVAERADERGVRRAEAVLAEHLLVLVGEDDAQQLLGAGLVLALGRDADVRAAGEDRGGRAGRRCRAAGRRRTCRRSTRGPRSWCLSSLVLSPV